MTVAPGGRAGAVSRRQLLGGAAMLAGGAMPAQPRSTASYVDVLRPPDRVTVFLESETLTLSRDGQRWTAPGIAVQASPEDNRMPVRIEAPQAPLTRIRLRWCAKTPRTWRVLNDQWERSYGDLEWRGMVDGRILPWYFLAFDGRRT